MPGCCNDVQFVNADNNLATRTLICQRGQIICQLTKKRARRDLNPRPTEPESVALSTEPRALSLPYYSTSMIKFAA